MKKIGLISLGCDKNTVDSESILSLFKKPYFEICTNLEECDAIIINTCGFILPAKEEAINTILDCIKYPNAKIIVCGCLVKRNLEELKEALPEVSLWVTFKDYPKFLELVCELLDVKIQTDEFDIFRRVLSTKSYSAFLKISEGCSNFCGFCAIPFIRGKYHSFDFNKIIEQAKAFAANGVKELIVISQDTGAYGKDFEGKNINLCTLLRELEKIDGIEFIRVLYLYPEEVTDEYIELVKNSKKLTHYFDIPIQHASNKVLKSMLRRDTKESVEELFNKIKKEIPDVIFRTTVIVGYPGETNEEFNELKKFIKEYKFNHLGCFTYSKEEGTYGNTLKDQIDEDVKLQRKEEIMKIQQEISYEENKKLIGREYKAIILSKKNNEYSVRCGVNAPDDIDGSIYLKSDKEFKEGDIVNIRITHAFVYDLYAEIVD